MVSVLPEFHNFRTVPVTTTRSAAVSAPRREDMKYNFSSQRN